MSLASTLPHCRDSYILAARELDRTSRTARADPDLKITLQIVIIRAQSRSSDDLHVSIPAQIVSYCGRNFASVSF